MFGAALLAACANQGDPPGGPPDVAPPAIVTVRPESGAVVADWKDDAVIQFDEVIDEMGVSSGTGAGITGLAKQVILSPVHGDVSVSWGRTRIRVKPKEGWKPGRVYHLELLPGIVDLRRNILKKGQLVVFSTGPAIPNRILTGNAIQWVEQRSMFGALIEAVPLPDSVGYLTVADSAGRFHLDALPPGRYVVYATADQNNNRRRDRREAYDSAAVTLDSIAGVALFAFVHDTVGPRVRTGTVVDSNTVRLEFSQALGVPLDTAHVRVLQLPDSTPVTIVNALTPPQYDSVTAAARKAKPDSARHDTTPAARAPAPARADTTAAPADTSELHRLLAQRPVPYDKAVLRFASALKPETRYVIRVSGAVNLNGASGDGQVVVLTPKPPEPVKADTAHRAPRTPP
ncbi:MAG TPA: Ig-like domain-containing protein [Gemmatimonadales bacterium]|nr:Ig-like domain-containing protein [Gemmatimonadales bacterium]